MAPTPAAPTPVEAPTPVPTPAYQPTGPPTIASDKADYAPGETVTLTGTNWAAGESVRIVVNDTYGSSWSRDVTVIATDHGVITDSFSLPSWFVSNYDVTASGPSGTVKTTFTDLSVDTYDQCSNDTGTGYTTGDTGCRWINGNLERNNSAYSEGDATVQRLWLTGLVPGSTHTITLQYGTTKGGHHAYDFLTSWNWSENWITDADRCQGIAGCESASDNYLGMSVDPSAHEFDVAADSVQPRRFTMRGGTLTSATTPTIVSGDYSGDSETSVMVTFTVPATGPMCTTDKKGVTTCGVALWFGAHVALTAQWKAVDGSTGAGGISGSPYHVSLTQLDGAAVGSRDNQMQAQAVLKNGNLVIVKDAIPNDPQDFSFRITNGTTITQNFLLDDDPGDTTLPNSRTFSLPAGAYTADELDIPAGWTLTNLACVVSGTNGSTFDLASPTATINLKTGFDTSDTVTCTYTDTHYSDLGISKTATPALTRTYAWGISKAVDKTTVNIADGGSATFNYTVNVTHDTGTDSLWAVTGQITVTNSNNVAVSGVAVSDAINDAHATCLVTGGSATIASGGSATFDYSCTYSAAPAAQTQTNTATVRWTAFGSVHTTASATKSVDWSAATVTRVDSSVSVSDSLGGTLGTVSYTDSSPKAFTYSKTFTGDPAGICTGHDNTATFTTNDTATTGSDSRTVTVCVGKDLTVTKTATASLTRTYKWLIDKSVDQTTVDISAGDTATFNYSVKVTPNGFTDSGWTLGGTITIANPNDWEAVTVSVADTLDQGGSCSITESGPYVVPKADSLILHYTCSSDGTTTKNTATVTWDKALYATLHASASGDAAVSFTVASEVNKTITVVDDKTDPQNPVTLGTRNWADGEHSFTYSLIKAGVAGVCTDYTNIAVIEETEQSDAQKVTLCVLEPNITVSKTADAASVSAGDPIGFTIEVANTGEGIARSVTLTDTLPTGAGIDWSVGGADGAACSIASGVLSCQFGDLASGASKTIRVTSPTTKDSCKTYDNTATATPTNGASGTSPVASVEVLCAAITITKVADAPSVSAGDTIGFTIVVTNTGEGIARSVTLSDTLPTDAGLSWSLDGTDAAACSVTSGVLTCAFGDLAKGVSKTVHLSSRTTAQTCGTVDNTASVTTTNDGSGQASDTVTVNCPDVTVAKTAVSGTVNAGDTAAFKVTVSNVGAGTAYNVTLTDTLPGGVAWVIDPPATGCAIAGSVLSCSWATLAAGASVEVDVSGPTTPAVCGTLDNAALVAASNEANTANNSAEATVTVNCPVDLTVSKTAAGTFNRTYLWKIAKAVDHTSVNIAEGGSYTFNYTVTVEQTGISDAGWTLAGKITITNPNSWLDITLTGLTDAVDNGGVCKVGPGPYVVPKGGSLEVAYSCAYASSPSSYSGLNTATATWDKSIGTPHGSASGSAAFTLAQLGSTNKTVHVTDSWAGDLGTVTATDSAPFAKGTFSYSRTESGVAGTCTKYDNTATITETNQTADKSVTLCVGRDLTVSKTAAGTFNRAYFWQIAKDVDKTSVNMASGGTATFNYTVTASQTGFTDSGWTLSGKITIANPNDWEDVTLTGLTDVVDNGGACTVAPGPYPVPKGGSIDVAYSCTYSSASSLSGTNTATATWDKATAFTPDGSATGTKAFTLAQAGSTNKTVTVSDTLGGTLGTVTATDGAPFASATFRYSHDFAGVGGTCKSYDNTATITETSQSASKTVEVCVGLDLTVSKTAEASFDRLYKWLIDKSVDQTRIDIAQGGTASFNYSVLVTPNGYTDSNWHLSGTITVANPNDWEAVTLTGLTDVVDVGGGVSCVVSDDGTGVVPASGHLDFTYTCSFTSQPNYSGTNTATATWDQAAAFTPSGSASGNAAVSINLNTETNKTITVVDDKTDPQNRVTLGTWSWPDGSHPFTYKLDKAGVAGACTDYTNTAVIKETLQSDKQTVTVCVGMDLTVTKTAAGTFDRTYFWKIAKAVDKTTYSNGAGGTATFNYTVTAAQTGFNDSGWNLSGVITITNPNTWQDVTLTGLTDVVTNGGACTVAPGPYVVPKGSYLDVAYSCTYSSASSLSGTNTATATWDTTAYATPTGTASGAKTFALTQAGSTNKTITVTDSYAGTLGTVTATDGSPFASAAYKYSRTIPVKVGCFSYDNTATITETGQFASQTVTVCGKTGALTMGFWQNKNGQGIITKGAATVGVCNSGTWVRQFAPFQDLAATASCKQVATYVYNVIKAADASGASMNAMLKAQMLATALDVYFSDAALGGNAIKAPASIGAVVIDLTQIKGKSSSTAFGGATSMSVMEMLTYAASQSNVGGSTWYGNVKSIQELAKDAFDAINNEWAVGP